MKPYDKTHPRSMYSLSPDFVRRGMDALSEEDWGISEEQYESSFGKADFMVNRVRLEFWREYDLCQSQVRRMEGANIASRCGVPLSKVEDVFAKRVNLLWILIPPGTYESFLDEALQFGLSRLRRELLSIPLYKRRVNRDGTEDEELDAKAADLLLKTVAFLDMRKNGGIVQKNLHVLERAKDFKEVATPEKELLAIEERIRELEKGGQMSRVLGDMDKVPQEASTHTNDDISNTSQDAEFVDTPYAPTTKTYIPKFSPEVIGLGGKKVK